MQKNLSQDALSQDALELRRAYKRDWARKNRAKARESENRYWEKKAEKMRQKSGAPDKQEKDDE